MNPKPQNQLRSNFVDTAKGVAIVSVVFGHVWRGLNSANLISDSDLFWRLDSAVYAFHMPLFFLASAIFFKPSPNLSKGLSSRAFRLLLPLIIWSWILALFKIVAGAASNSGPPSFAETLLYPFPPKAVFWFLLALFLAQVWSDIISRVASKNQRIIATVMSVILCVFLYTSGATPTWLHPALLHVPYFLIGTQIAFLMKTRPLPIQQCLSLLVFLACVFLGMKLGSSLDSMSALLTIALGTVAAISLIKGSALLSGTRLGQLLQFLGQSSFAIYVCHVIFTAAARIALVKLGINSLLIQGIAGTLVGMCVPVILLIIARRLKLSRIVMLDPPNPPQYLR